MREAQLPDWEWLMNEGVTGNRPWSFNLYFYVCLVCTTAVYPSMIAISIRHHENLSGCGVAYIARQSHLEAETCPQIKKIGGLPTLSHDNKHPTAFQKVYYVDICTRTLCSVNCRPKRMILILKAIYHDDWDILLNIFVYIYNYILYCIYKYE